MKIVVCIWSFFGGGAERVAVLLANALAGRGVAVKLYFARREGPNLELVAPEVELVLAPPGGPKAYLLGLRQLIREWHPDVVQAHQTTRNVLAIIAHLSTSGRSHRLVIAVEHGEMQHTVRHNKGLGLRAFFALTRVLYPFADRIVSVSDNVCRSVVAHLRPFRATQLVMNNPVVFAGLQGLAAAKPDHPWLATADDRPTIISLGRLEPQKNFALLIDSFKILSVNSSARLIIFGEGSLRSDLEAQISKSGLSGRVDLPGYAINPFAALRSADLFVLSSHWEGLPTVAIEALACGTPVVSTDNSSGVRQIVSSPVAGKLVPCGDAATLASAMANVLEMPRKRDELTKFSKAYEADTVANEHIVLYHELLAAKIYG